MLCVDVVKLVFTMYRPSLQWFATMSCPTLTHMYASSLLYLTVSCILEALLSKDPFKM